MTRICKYCGEEFNTEKRYSKICKNCKKENHKKKVKRTLNLL